MSSELKYAKFLSNINVIASYVNSSLLYMIYDLIYLFIYFFFFFSSEKLAILSHSFKSDRGEIKVIYVCMYVCMYVRTYVST